MSFNDQLLRYQVASWMGAKERQKLYRKLSVLLGNGVPLKEALTDLHRRYARRSKRHPFVYALDAWLKRMHEGKSNFDSIVDGWIPSEERMLFTGGTDLHRSLTSAADVMDSKRAIRGTIVKKTAMPIVLVVMAIVVVYILAGNLIPTIIDTMPPGAVLVGLGGTVKATSETIIHGLPYGVAALFAFICFAAWSPSRLTGPFRDRFLGKVPPWSLYSMTTGVIWMVSSAAMLRAGLDMRQILEYQRKVASPWLEAELAVLYREMHKGRPIGVVMSTSGRHFPNMEVVDDIAIYSQTRDFADALDLLAKEWREEIVESVSTKMAVINIIILVFIAFIIIFFVGGMFDMLSQLSDSLSSAR
jgi:type II secretory pathway component PulF